jgi:hypothetical protein
MLRVLLDGSQTPVAVWGEGLATAEVPEGVRLRDRLALQPAETLVIWTAPPGVREWEAALATVAPKEVVLVCLDPGLDAPRAFLQRLAGVVKYALREYAGRTRLATLAAATAQTEWAVRLGLRWLAARGQVAFDAEGSRVVLRPAGDGTAAEDRERIERQLWAELHESAAYRAYLRAADADRLVNKVPLAPLL